MFLRRSGARIAGVVALGPGDGEDIDKLKVHYGVARQTANRAVQHPASEGLLYSEGRRGTFIRPPAPATPPKMRQQSLDGLQEIFEQAMRNLGWRTLWESEDSAKFASQS